MERKEKKKLIMAIAFFVIAAVFFVVNKVNGASKKNTWEKAVSGTIVDVDPLADNGSAGMFYEFDGSFVWLWSSEIEGRWPVRGETGTFYKNRDSKKYKWEKDKTVTTKKTTSVKATMAKKYLPSKIVNRASQTWSSIITSLPPVGKTVLVRYKNGVTITTAYINVKKQWKLETDRERISGGREITTIKEWRIILE